MALAQVNAVLLSTFEDLQEHLDHLNADGIGDTAIVLDRDSFAWLAYCTDPDADWFIESGDPHERMRYENGEGWYDRLGLDWIEKRGPYRVIAERGAL